VVEQMTYGPAALACFFFGMSLMEGKSVEHATEELKMKFLPSYKVRVMSYGQRPDCCACKHDFGTWRVQWWLVQIAEC
jgi:hypothetical protein